MQRSNTFLWQFPLALAALLTLSACGPAAQSAAPMAAPTVSVAQVIEQPITEWDAFTVLAAGGLILGLGSLDNARAGVLGSKVGVYLGEISYSIYMVCAPVLLLGVNVAARLTGADDKRLHVIVWLAVLAAIPVAIFAPFGLFLVPLGAAVLAAGANLYAWEFRRHAIDASQVYASHGFFSPTRQIATRLKLHSVEIAQGPLARRGNYATLRLGLAGGTLSFEAVPLSDARRIRAAVLDSIAGVDFSRLNSG